MWLGQQLIGTGRGELRGGSSPVSSPPAIGRLGFDEALVDGFRKGTAKLLGGDWRSWRWLERWWRLPERGRGSGVDGVGFRLFWRGICVREKQREGVTKLSGGSGRSG